MTCDRSVVSSTNKTDRQNIAEISLKVALNTIKPINRFIEMEIETHQTSSRLQWCPFQGRIQDFKLGGAHLKKLRRAEGGAKNFGVFRVKNHDFTPKKSDFFPNAEGSAKIFGVFRVKNHDFTPKNHIFSNFWGGGAQGCAPPPPESAPAFGEISSK